VKHQPKAIFLAARTQSKAEIAIEDIRKVVPTANIQYLPLDLTSFTSIKGAAEAFTSLSDRLDILINNAGKSIRDTKMSS
jgi:NAD(P)-dependent dehydrogenase (short-subunit alcohol dehydrogenase family)